MMMTNALQANATPLPVLVLLRTAEEPADPEIISDLATWSAAVGRTSADVAAILFKMPLPEDLRAAFEDSIRQEIVAEMIDHPHVDDDDRERIEDIAWIAFSRRLARHEVVGSLPPARA